MIEPVVSVDWLAEHPDVVVADVRWYFDGRSAREAYRAGHLPGAVFVDLETVLAAPAFDGSGRHPLPTPEAFAAGMSAVGIGDGATVVAYDDAGGATAGRLVWLLRLLGVDAALLDGGIGAWNGELEVGDGRRGEPAHFTARPWDPAGLATIDDAVTGTVVVDARAAERYQGLHEPLDPRAGHIPAAINVPFGGNLDAAGRFLSPAELAQRFRAAGITDADDVIVYCGSGVTACHNLIALERAGLGRGRLYVGSWSQYSRTGRPVATGPEPGTHPPLTPRP